VLGGCGTVLLIGVVAAAVIGYLAARKVQQVANNPAMATAKMMVAMNPDLETVSTDEAKGTITIKDRTTGKIVTVNFDAVKDGKIVFKGEGDENVTIEAKGGEGSGSLEVKTDKGSMKFGAGSGADKLPDWLPSYPGAKAEGVFSMRGDDGSTGSFSFTTTDSVDQVMSYYETELKGEDLRVSVTTTKTNGITGGVVTGEDKGKGRTAVVTVGAKSGGAQVNVTFVSKD
jgi:hypothetical protein